MVLIHGTGEGYNLFRHLARFARDIQIWIRDRVLYTLKQESR
jgi:hypothetical protein